MKLPDFASGNTGPGNVPDMNPDVPRSTMKGAGTKPPKSGVSMQSRLLSKKGYTGSGRTKGALGKSPDGVTASAPIPDYVTSTQGSAAGAYN